MCTDVNTERKIVVENQLTKSDHSHLGKLLTYSAGLDAGIVVWITKELEEAHRSAIEWLNDISDPEVSFFAVKPEVIRVEDSKPGVRLNLIVKPDDWRKTIKATTGGISDRDSQYKEFFGDLIERIREKRSDLTNIKPQPQSWIGWGAGKAGLSINWAFRRGNRFSVGLFIDTGDSEENLEILNELRGEKEEIEDKTGGLSWEELEDSRACRIASYKQMPRDFMKLSDEELEEIKKWGIQQMGRFQEYFPPRIRKM